jgi:heme oxygenase
MTVMINAATTGPRHRRLGAAIDNQHENLHMLVASLAPFESRENFARLVEVQYRFQYLIEPLYRRSSLQAVLPDLPVRCRRAAATADLADLGRSVPWFVEEWADSFTLPHALGWLFVSGGSTLGAAVLLQRAEPLGLSETFGARHLAAGPMGLARHWKRFVDALDAVPLCEAHEADVIGGARAAFGYFGELIVRARTVAADAAVGGAPRDIDSIRRPSARSDDGGVWLKRELDK